MTPQHPANYLDQGSGAFLRSQLEAMRNKVYATMVSADHTKAWDADQLALQRKINDLARQSNSGVDPERLTGTDEFEHLTLEQIRDLAYQIKPDVVQAVSEAWAEIGKNLAEASTTLSDSLKGPLTENWQGQTAGRAIQAVGKFLDTSAAVGTAAAMVGLKVAFAQRGSAETARMLHPVLEAAAPSAPNPQIPGTSALKPTVPGSLASLVPTLAGVQSAESQKEEARQASLQVLRNVYSPAIHGGDQGVPVLPSVQPIAHPAGPATTNPITPGTTTPTATTPSSSTATPSAAAAASQQQPDPSASTQPTSTTPPMPDFGHSATTPASTTGPGNSTTATTPAGVGEAAGTGGGLSYSGTGGGLGGSDSGNSRPGGPGSSVPGKSTPAAPAGTSVNASRISTTNSGAGMMSPAAHSKSEDKEHKVSDLLRGQHLEEWIGTGEQVLPAYGAIGLDQEPERPHTTQKRRKKKSDQQKPPDPPRPGTVQGEYR